MKFSKLAIIGALVAGLSLTQAQVSADGYPKAKSQVSQKVYRPGELLKPNYTSQTGRKLSFEIRGIARGLLLKETSAGTYEGRLMVLPSMAPYEGTLLVRELGTGEVLSQTPLKIEAGPVAEIQASSDRGEIRFAFDETIRAQTVTVTMGERTLQYPDDIDVRSNFFHCDTLGTDLVTIEAQTVDGQPLRRVLEVDSL